MDTASLLPPTPNNPSDDGLLRVGGALPPRFTSVHLDSQAPHNYRRPPCGWVWAGARIGAFRLQRRGERSSKRDSNSTLEWGRAAGFGILPRRSRHGGRWKLGGARWTLGSPRKDRLSDRNPHSSGRSVNARLSGHSSPPASTSDPWIMTLGHDQWS